MNLLDGIFGALTIALAVRAGLRGFVKEFLSMIALIAAAAGGVFGYRPLAPAFESWFPGTVFPEVIAFLCVFLVVFVVMKLLEKSLADLAERMGIGATDHVLGALFGLLEAFLVVCLFLLLLQFQTFFDMTPIFAGSWTARNLLPLVATEENLARLRPLVESLGGPPPTAVPAPAPAAPAARP